MGQASAPAVAVSHGARSASSPCCVGNGRPGEDASTAPRPRASADIDWLALRFQAVDERLLSLSERLTLLGERLDGSLNARRATAPTTHHTPTTTGVHPADWMSDDDDPSAPAATGDPPLRPPPVPGELQSDQRSASAVESSPSAGPVVQGTLSGLTLGTLFSLLEFERSSGLLTLRQDEQYLQLLLRDGAIVRSELDATRTTATEAIRTACAWSQAAFTFRRDARDEGADPPRSANALMLEALRHRDETARVG